ncbi:MFS transporter [Chloroflexota bacterium]
MLQRVINAPVFSALHHRNYRLYWVGLLISLMGFNIQMFARAWLAYDITGSPLFLGLVGGASAVPTIVFTLLGGVVADKVDRRRMLMLTQFISAFLAFILATLVFTGLVTIWHILVIAFFSGTVQAFERPARMSIVPLLLEDKKDLMNAIALDSALWNTVRIIGPAIAGFLTVTVGIAVCFYLTSAGYLSMIGVLYYVKLREQSMGGRVQSMWTNMKEGVGYVWRNHIFLILIGLTFVGSLFGDSYRQLMPIFARDILMVGPQGFGFLLGASGIGALAGALIVGSLGNFMQRGRLILFGSLVCGLLLLLFARSHLYLLSLSVVALAGVSHTFYMITIHTLLQSLVPDALRGRVMGIYGLNWSLHPLGGLLQGTIAYFWGAPVAVTLGGWVVIAFSLFIATATPLIRRIR